MADVLIVHPRHRGLGPEWKELAANASGSVIFVIVALVLLRPLMVSQMLLRADAYAAVGQFDESQRQCDKALLIDSESSEAWHQQARLSKAQGDREAACEAYRKATAADSTNWQAHFELGTMYVEDGLHQMAIPHFEQVRKLGAQKKGTPSRTAPYHRETLEVLALCYEKVGDLAKMEFTLEELRIFYPGYGNAEARLAQHKANPANRR